MANLTKNALVRNASGKFGDEFVFRTRGKKTTIARLPKIKEDAVKTAKQVKVNSRFKSASEYAKSAISSGALKKEYQRKVSTQNTAFNVAFRDYLRAPEVTAIDIENYKGSIGSTIVISATDDFKVVAVKVSIRSAAGVLIEEGNAVPDPIFSELWTYTATQANSALAGTVISATAADLPRNKGGMSVTV